MSNLVDIALSHTSSTGELRVLDAACGDGRHLVALAERMYQSSDGAPAARVADVFRRLRGAALEDDGAERALAEWAATHDVSDVDVPVSYGDPLAFAAEPVQGDLFEAVESTRPPGGFADGPFDLVIADIPRRELDPLERERLREGYSAASGRFSYEAPYAERAIHLAALDGVVAIRLRSAVVRREFGRSLVEEVLAGTEIVAVESAGEYVLIVCRPGGEATGAALVRAFGSEEAARALRAIGRAAPHRLVDWSEHPIGRTSSPGCDDVWEPPPYLRTLPTTTMIRGEDLIDWSVARARRVIWPYDSDGRRLEPPPRPVIDWLARFRSALEARRYFGRTLEELDVRWFEYVDHHPERWSRVPGVVLARNGRDPSAVIVRTPTVVAGNALSISTRDDATTCFVAGVLNSSLGCFWMKQVFHVYETAQGLAFEATASSLGELPLPDQPDDRVVEIARRLDRLGRSIVSADRVVDGEPDRLASRLEGVRDANARVRRELQYWQEELDWAVYASYGLVPERLVRPLGPVAARVDDPEEPSDEFGRSRRAFIESDATVGLIESTEFKRRWRSADPETAARDALTEWLADRVERGFAEGALPAERPVRADEVADWLRSQPLERAVLARIGFDVAALLLEFSAPLEASRTFARSGLEKLRAMTEGEHVTFTTNDYSARPGTMPTESSSQHRRRLWRLRGRYNVPSERFVHLAEISERLERPLFAWAGAGDEARRELVDRVSEPDDVEQIDLERLLEMKAELSASPRSTIAELADRLWGRGWTYREVRLALGVLEQSGTH